MSDTKLVINVADGTEEEVPLTADEIAQRATDATTATAARAHDAQVALGQIRAKRDRWLAQTDVFALPPASFPADMPKAVSDAVAANLAAWKTFRQQLRDYMATVDDPYNPPPFPAQPAAPPVVLT